jgi:hypothetical protein
MPEPRISILSTGKSRKRFTKVLHRYGSGEWPKFRIRITRKPEVGCPKIDVANRVSMTVPVTIKHEKRAQGWSFLFQQLAGLFKGGLIEP